MTTSMAQKRLVRARNAWRVCAAAEVAFAEHGALATASHILKAGGFSRRTLYDLFRSVEHVLARMTWAADQFDHTDAGVKYVEQTVPTADHVLCAMPLDFVRDRDMSGVDFGNAFEARAKRVEIGPQPIPTNQAFLLWYAETVLSG